MASGTQGQSFARTWLFVDSAKESKERGRLHAVRESARQRRWQNEQNRLNAGKADIVKSGSLSWQNPKDPSLSKTDQTSDDDGESDSDMDIPGESASKSKSLSPIALRSCKSSISSKRRRSLGAITGNSILQKPSQSCIPDSLSPRSILGAGRVNPFDTYPAPNSMQTLDGLVDFCKFVLNFERKISN